MAAYGLKGQYTTEDIHDKIIGFLRLKDGGEASHREIDLFLRNHLNVEFSQINHVIHILKKSRPQTVGNGSNRGFVKLVD